MTEYGMWEHPSYIRVPLPPPPPEAKLRHHHHAKTRSEASDIATNIGNIFRTPTSPCCPILVELALELRYENTAVVHFEAHTVVVPGAWYTAVSTSVIPCTRSRCLTVSASIEQRTLFQPCMLHLVICTRYEAYACH